MARDLNGHPVSVSRTRRLLGRLTGGRAATDDVVADDPDLVVVAESFDDAAASSEVLADSRWRSDEQAVVRHFLALPRATIDAAVAMAAQDGYERVEVADPSGVSQAVAAAPNVSEHTVIALARPQLVDALHCAQERSRMAGLGARHDGTVLGWQVLQPPTA